jgi:NADPH:quinone reductase-like Zn-dependent oxidoreductase
MTNCKPRRNEMILRVLITVSLFLTSVEAFASNHFLLSLYRGSFPTSSLRLSQEDSPHSWIVPQGVSFGSLDKLKFDRIEESSASTTTNTEEGLCRISTRAIGLNFADIFCLLGLYSAANQVRDGNDVAFCPGLEYSGVVVDDPTHTFAKGQRVLGFTRFGAYADVVQVPPYFLHPLPDHWSFRQGAGFMVQALTAWHGLVEIGGMPNVVKNKQKAPYVVLIHSAAGGVGLWASEIAARRGAIVIGVIGTPEKARTFEDRILSLSPKSRTLLRGEERTFGRRLAELLCDVHGIATTNLPDDESELEQLREDGRGVDLVMESLGGQYFTDSFEAMNKGGSLVTFGSTSYVSPGLSINKLRLIWRYLNRPRVDPGTLTSRNIRLAGFNLIFLTDTPDELRRELRECILCLGGSSADQMGSTSSDERFIPLDNVEPPVIGETFDFRTQSVEALERLKGGKTVGKIVLDNSDNTAI